MPNRQYDPALARWHVTDAMSEQYMSHSPYTYVMNNPINAVDVMGLWSFPVYFDGVYGGTMSGTGSGWDNATYSGAIPEGYTDMINSWSSGSHNMYRPGARTRAKRTVWDAGAKFWKTKVGKIFASLVGWQTGISGSNFQRFKKSTDGYYIIEKTDISLWRISKNLGYDLNTLLEMNEFKFNKKGHPIIRKGMKINVPTRQVSINLPSDFYTFGFTHLTFTFDYTHNGKNIVVGDKSSTLSGFTMGIGWIDSKISVERTTQNLIYFTGKGERVGYFFAKGIGEMIRATTKYSFAFDVSTNEIINFITE